MANQLYQRGADGNCVPGDAVTHAAYGPIPDADKFQNERGQVETPVTVHGWVWSPGFRRWTALVTFASGWHGYTWPVKGA